MVWCERGVGRSPRQTYRTTAEIRDIAIVVISLHNSANVSDVMDQARQYEIGIVGCGGRPQHRSSHQDVVPGKADEQGVFNVVVQRVAVADALQSELGRKREKFSQPRI